ncbi:hypothetical protein [Nonomuraea candida]|nr:hypothetical protein [Nonomuraea candida]
MTQYRSRWDPVFGTTTITSGRAALLEGLPCAVVLDDQRLVHVARPARQP